MAKKERDRRTVGGEGAVKAVGQRRRRVGEELRHLIAQVLRDGDYRDPVLRQASITVSEVRVSPDLRNATAYVMPLGGVNASEILAALKRSAPVLRGLVARQLTLRHAPNLTFALDETFDHADRIAALLALPEVERDLSRTPASDAGDSGDAG